jgi:hypothetical protein
MKNTEFNCNATAVATPNARRKVNRLTLHVFAYSTLIGFVATTLVTHLRWVP